MSDFSSSVARRATTLLARTYGVPLARSVVAVLDGEGLLARAADRINGAFPVWVRRRPVGVELDVTPLVSALVVSLAAEAAEDPEGVGQELADLYGASGPERDELVQKLVDRLGGANMLLTAADARHLADRLLVAAGGHVPQQRKGVA
ncbi:hypothetical protein [Streptomyces kaniharaensis]|uniref:hypothetical protein n=1 Tax=Streptomyces kaniharaensis TaxID=212423 RepID=UPI001297DB2F|nr:hypothetical protein [Streptomyces kaniharaensis]